MGTAIPLLSSLAVDEIGPGCEPIAKGFLREPVSAYSSLAFVVAGLLILVLERRRRRRTEDAQGRPGVETSSVAYTCLVAGIGLGSVAQHGPNLYWADLAHDLPLLGTLVLIISDGAADLTGRARAWWWWALPTAALAPLIHWFPQPGDMTQGAVAVVAVLLSLVRAYRRPRLRPPIVWTVVLLATGGVLEILSSPGWPLCRPDSLWYGHAAWHAFVAAGLTALAGALSATARAGRRSGPDQRSGRDQDARSLS